MISILNNLNNSFYKKHFTNFLIGKPCFHKLINKNKNYIRMDTVTQEIQQKENVKYIIGLGNPIIDISATAEEESLKTYNLEYGRTVFKNDENVGIYAYLESQKDVSYIPGGSITNSIRITNWLLNKSPSYRCMLLGCIGNDSYGKKISEALQQANVDPILEMREDMLSSRCAVAVHLKERCLVPEIRASTMLSMDFVDKNLEKILKASIYLIEGYFVIERYDIILRLAEEFAKLNKTIAFTLSAVFMVEAFRDRIIEVSNKSHIIFCNNEEAEAFTKNTSGNFEEISIQMHKTLAPLDRILVITCGKNPVVISKYNYAEDKLDFLLKSYVYSVPDEEIVDTNGCGDSFVGGFLSQYIQGKSLEVCARVGNWASSVIIRNVGATYPEDLEIKKF